MANLSILGLYTWDNTIFDNMVLPAEIDKDILVDNILMDYAELEVLYPDSEFMKSAIGSWSKARLRTWSKMANVLYEDYDPFINIKRDETRTITQERDLQGSGIGENSVSAWNETDYTNRNKTDTVNYETGTVTTTEHFHVEGDSAITDAQDVARKEIELRSENDMYQIIKNDFKRRFLIMVY